MFRQTANQSEAPPTMPGAIAEAGLWANSLYPQMHTGLNITIGAAATKIVLEGDVSWQQIVDAEHTPEQVDALIERVNAMHKAFVVPCKLRDPAKPDVVERGAYYFTPVRLTALTTHALSTAQTINANFARVTLPELADVGPLDPIDFLGGKTELRNTTEQSMIDTLFRRSTWLKRPRPEAVALSGLWNAAADTLASKPAREISKSYRKVLSPPPNERLSASDRKGARATLTQAVSDLHGVITDGVSSCIPEIAKETGIKIDEQTVSSFVDTVSTNIVVPQRLRN